MGDKVTPIQVAAAAKPQTHVRFRQFCVGTGATAISGRHHRIDTAGHFELRPGGDR